MAELSHLEVYPISIKYGGISVHLLFVYFFLSSYIKQENLLF